MQDEKAIDQVREEMQEGQKEAEVPEDMLRARLPRLNIPLTSAPSSRLRVRGRGRVYGNCPLPQPAICARRSSTRAREAVRCSLCSSTRRYDPQAVLCPSLWHAERSGGLERVG